MLEALFLAICVTIGCLFSVVVIVSRLDGKSLVKVLGSIKRKHLDWVFWYMILQTIGVLTYTFYIYDKL